MLDSVAGELVRVRRGEDKVTLELGVDDLNERARQSAPASDHRETHEGTTHLADDVLVRDADDKTVLRRVVLVLGLRYETLARVVVGLTLCGASTGSARRPECASLRRETNLCVCGT